MPVNPRKASESTAEIESPKVRQQRASTFFFATSMNMIQGDETVKFTSKIQ